MLIRLRTDVWLHGLRTQAFRRGAVLNMHDEYARALLSVGVADAAPNATKVDFNVSFRFTVPRAKPARHLVAKGPDTVRDSNVYHLRGPRDLLPPETARTSSSPLEIAGWLQAGDAALLDEATLQRVLAAAGSLGTLWVKPA